MTDEERLNKMIDRLNENSHYGLLDDKALCEEIEQLKKENEELKEEIRQLRDKVADKIFLF